MRILITALVAVNSLQLLVHAATTTYNVISIAGSNHTMGVIVDGKTYPLQASKDIAVLHSGTAPSGAYSYAKLDTSNGVVEKEAFQRQLDQSSKATLNEFYNRTWNTQHVADLPAIVDPLPSKHRVDSPLHPKDQIPTIYFSGDQQQIDLMHANVTADTKVTLDMHLISTDKVTTIKGVEISLAGRSSKWLEKLSYGLKTPKDQALFGYRSLKLRALAADPSYIREVLCYDMMNAMGLPVSGASYTRVIMNDQPVGLFLMIEAYKNDWQKNEFGDGKKLKDGRGITYQGMGSGSDLSTLGGNVTLFEASYKVQETPDKKHGGDGTPSYDRLMDFTKFLADAPTTTDDAADVWNQHIDMDSVIRSLVVEIIGGFADGYLANSNNFFLYDNLAEKRFTYLAADFDTTVGNTMVKLSDMWSGNYTQFPGLTLRPLVQKFLQVPAFKSQFEQLLSKASQQLINSAAINPRIDDLVKMLRQDVDWDLALPKMNKDSDNGLDELFNYLLSHPEMLPPPLDLDTIKDMAKRKPMPWDTFVTGPTNEISLSGVKEFFERQSKAMQDYFGQHPPATV